jgi:hypothetical protein
LVLKTYGAEKINGEMVITPDDNGNYKAGTAQEVYTALTTGVSSGVYVEVKIGKKWRVMTSSYDRRGEWLSKLTKGKRMGIIN